MEQITTHGFLLRDTDGRPAVPLLLRLLRTGAAPIDALRPLFHGGGKFLVVKRFEQIGANAERDRLLRKLELSIARENDVLRVDLPPQLLDDLKSRDPRHFDIHNEDVGAQAAREENPLHAAAGIADDLCVKVRPRRHAHNALPLQRLVVNDEYLNHNGEPPPMLSRSTRLRCPLLPRCEVQCRSAHRR